jgi:uncharacterized protein (DUF1501 family)
MATLNRRKFLDYGIRGAAAATLGRFCELNAYAASANTSYKALVCILLDGGNDCHNTVVPIITSGGASGKQGWADYNAIRPAIAIPQASLLSIGARAGKDTYGLHFNLTNIRSLYAQKKAAILANVGNLAGPTTQASYQASVAANDGAIPAALFSHSDQVQQWLTATPNDFATTGWAGRIADLTRSGSTDLNLPMNVTAAGDGGLFGVGAATVPTSVWGLNVTQNASLTVSTSLMSSLGSGLYNTLFNFSNGLQLVQASNSVTNQGLRDHQTLVNAINTIDTTWGGSINASLPTTSDPLLAQFRLIAQVIAATAATSSQVGVNNQIFFIRQGPYDTHSLERGTTALTQDTLLAALDMAVGQFQAVIAAMGLDNQVVTFTNSEFGRTLMSNANGGTDHAWGGHHFIIGGPVKGGEIYGTFPTLMVGGPDDVSSTPAATRGVTIPTTSVAQYAATLANWFGVPSANLSGPNGVFPNLGNFANPTLTFI